MNTTAATPSTEQAWVITGPTSGIGRRTVRELARHGTVVLVGRDRAKLTQVQAEFHGKAAGRAVSIVGDFTEIRSVRLAADQIAALGQPIGVLNNAGIMPRTSSRSAQGWDVAFAVRGLIQRSNHHVGTRIGHRGILGNRKGIR